MTEQEIKEYWLNKKATIDWLRTFVGIPENLVLMTDENGRAVLCPECKLNIIFGMKLENGVICHLKTFTGQIKNFCGDCDIKHHNELEIVKMVAANDYIKWCEDNRLPFGTDRKKYIENQEKSGKKSGGKF